MNRSRTVVDVQRRLAELGRIRLGEKTAKGGPKRLGEFRLTSYRQDLIEAAARLYGGEAAPWEDAPNEGAWQVTTTADMLPIIIPPGVHPFSQSYELWKAGGCQRRCDGEFAFVRQGNGVRERPCICDADNRECQITTRVNVMLPDLPGVGVWRVESHGWNAALELTTALELFTPVLEQGGFIRGRLRIENRSKKTPGEGTRRFVVPVIDVDTTIGQMLDGASGSVQTITDAVPRKPQLPPPPVPPVGGAVPVIDDAGAPLPTLGAPPPLPPVTAPPVIDHVPAPAPVTSQTPVMPPVASELPTMAPQQRGPIDDGHVPPPASLPVAGRRVISKPQQKRLWVIARERQVSEDEIRRIVAARHPDGNESTGQIAVADYEAICDELEGFLPPTPDEQAADAPADATDDTETDDTVDGLVAFAAERGLPEQEARQVITSAGGTPPKIIRAMLATAARGHKQ